MTGRLNALQAEVYAINVEKGWFDQARSYGMGCALLHSEISEALEAWRIHGTADATKTRTVTDAGIEWADNPKPEGVGSELADVVIRAVDMATRHAPANSDLDASWEAFNSAPNEGPPPPEEDFGDALAALHCVVSLGYEGNGHPMAALTMVTVLIWLVEHYAEKYGIDLEAEIARKVAYNRTRPHRHGGRSV